MALDDKVIRILQKYKYSNMPLETTLKELTIALGYTEYKTSREGDFAQDMCSYKWNRMTSIELIKKIKSNDYLYSEKTPQPLAFDYGTYGA